MPYHKFLLHQNRDRMRALCERYGMTNTEVLSFLLDLHDMDKIELIIRRLKIKHAEGLTVPTLNQLSVLHSYLSQLLMGGMDYIPD